MKMVTAVIKHFKLDDVRKGLTEIGVQGMTAIATFIILKIVDTITGLRVSSKTETAGLDIEEHGEQGYFI